MSTVYVLAFCYAKSCRNCQCCDTACMHLGCTHIIIYANTCLRMANTRKKWKNTTFHTWNVCFLFVFFAVACHTLCHMHYYAVGLMHAIDIHTNTHRQIKMKRKRMCIAHIDKGTCALSLVDIYTDELLMGDCR